MKITHNNFYQKKPCKRCGKLCLATNKSILGLDYLHEKYMWICSKCLTEPERKEMVREMAEIVATNLVDGHLAEHPQSLLKDQRLELIQEYTVKIAAEITSRAKKGLAE